MSETSATAVEKPAELIRPCPFCGAQPKVRISMEEYPADDDHPAGSYDAWYNICCDDCGIEVGAEYRSEALESWNKRNAPKRNFTGYHDVPEPLPMEAEIWAAGADPETAHFVARLLGYQGYELIQNEPAEDEEFQHVWVGKVSSSYGELEQCSQCGAVKRASNADAVCCKAGVTMEHAAEAVWGTLIDAIKPDEGQS